MSQTPIPIGFVAAMPRFTIADLVRTAAFCRVLRFSAVVLSIALTTVACDDGHLRGSTKRSSDGKTYLVIVDDNGGQCGPMMVDGKVWPHPIGEAGAIAPGRHTIECGTQISFEIPAGVVFRFDYWGP